MSCNISPAGIAHKRTWPARGGLMGLVGWWLVAEGMVAVDEER
jgi:hypothetical protein